MRYLSGLLYVIALVLFLLALGLVGKPMWLPTILAGYLLLGFGILTFVMSLFVDEDPPDPPSESRQIGTIDHRGDSGRTGGSRGDGR